MQVCWNCGAKQLDGTVFCSECGAGLLGVQTDRETTAALSQPVDSSDHAVQPMVVPAPDDDTAQGATFRLVVLNSGQAVELNVANDVLVGREDKARSVRPDLDLGLYGGYDAGVSRRHARILYRDDDYLLEDLGSANGTFVNGKLLSPRQPTPIKNGDEIAFGTMLLRVEV